MHKAPLFPEWSDQEAVILAWPTPDTDWLQNLDDVIACYLEIIRNINRAQATVILLCDPKFLSIAKSHIHYRSKVLIVPCRYNDTWVRDYAFLTLNKQNQNIPINFRFNGWGNKFDSQHDNAINTILAKLCKHKMINSDVVLEGGAIEINEDQHLLSTQSCLLNPKRNQDMTLNEYIYLFNEQLGAKATTIFEYGHLDGDDTDGHIDTLVRFSPMMNIVVQSAFNRPDDPHFEPLKKLEAEVTTHFKNHQVLRLPLADISNKSDERLPASYANFLILNKHILMPIYQQEEDKLAKRTIQKAFPNYAIIDINCTSLIQQFGSLHCITMQVPHGTLKSHFLEQASQGVSVLEMNSK